MIIVLESSWLKIRVCRCSFYSARVEKKRETFGLDFLFPSSIITLFNKEIALKEASSLQAYIL